MRLTNVVRSLLLLTAISTEALAQSPTAPVLRLSQTIQLPGVQGGFDHFAYDPVRKRLFLAAEDNGTVEVIGLGQAHKIQSISGFKNPHSILVRPTSSTILVTDSGADTSALLSSANLKKIRNLKLALGANCIYFDAQKKKVYVTAGGDRVKEKTSTLQAVDPDTGKVLKSVNVDAIHLQPMTLDPTTGRLFVNLADQNTIGIYNRDSLARIGTWKIPKGNKNSPIAFDPKQRRLFVIASDPGILLQLDADSGELQASISTPTDPDDMNFDPASQRIFVPGDGALSVYDVSDPRRIKLIQRVKTGKDAKTGMMLQSAGRYVVAVPAADGKAAHVLIFDIAKEMKGSALYSSFRRFSD